MSEIDRTTGLVGYSGMKVPVRAATTAAITLSGEQTIDGIACVDGDRVLVKDQASGVDNGIYVADTGAWARAADADGSYDFVSGSLVPVSAGTVSARAVYMLTTTGTITPGTTSLTFAAMGLFATPVPIASGGTGAITAAAARTALAVLGTAGGTMTGSIAQAEGAAVASAGTINIWATDGDTIHITGATGPITDMGAAPQAGAWKKLIFDSTPTLTQGANLNLNAGGANIAIEAGDVALVYADTTTQLDVFVFRKTGLPTVSSTIPVAATQAEQEAGSSTTAFTAPGRQQFHPSAAKGWVEFDATGALLASYNVASVTDTGSGNWTVVWGTDFSSGNYSAVAQGVSASTRVGEIDVSTKAAGTTVITSWISTANADTTKTANDSVPMNVVAFGDQA